MATIAYPLRIPEEILNLSRLRAQEQHFDQTTALRQFLHFGAEKYILELLSEGRISIGRAAELLKATIYDIQQLARRNNVQLGPTTQQMEKSRETAKHLLSKHKKVK